MKAAEDERARERGPAAAGAARAPAEPDPERGEARGRSAPETCSVGVPRRLPIGAEVLADGRVHVRVWAPRPRRVAVVLEGGGRAAPLDPEGDGYFSGFVPGASDGALYRLQLDDEGAYPDPASRAQPEGPHGPSRVVDPSRFPWTDGRWAGPRLDGQVIYELHVGTFTREGTWAAAAAHLPALAELGVGCVEMMPVADFAGRFGWGYDGVSLFAPTRLYGEPDDLRRFVDQAHAHGVAVILDVVYNHLGPDGNYLPRFAPGYFTDRHRTDWGAGIDFDGPGARPVREFFLANARHWIDEYRFDGLRLDATQSIVDTSREHIVAAVARAARAAARGRSTIVVAENEPQEVRLVTPAERGGFGLDAVWNDDFHHSAVVAATGKGEAYYSDYRGHAQELLSAVKHGFLFQGQRSKWQRARRGSPALDVPPQRFVTFVENHDQVANSARGRRLHQLTSPGRYRAITALLLLAPGTPMLFQGQEFAASAPFLFFADHGGELGRLVREGRAAFLAQFATLGTPQARALLADPTDPATFLRCKLDHAERDRHADVLAMHRDLLGLRRGDPVLAARRPRAIDGAVLGPEAFVLRFFGEDGDDRLLAVNLGADLPLDPAPEPLLAPPAGAVWQTLWSSDDPRYGGLGTPALETRRNWRLPGHAAVLLRPDASADDLARGGDEPTEEEEMRREALRWSATPG